MAVYTEIPDSDLAHFLQDYELGAAIGCKGIAEGVENSNFLLRTEKGFYILTLFEKRVAEPDLPYFIGLMDHLRGKGFLCPLPVRNRKGEALTRLCQKPAAIVSFLDGIWVRQPQALHLRELGKAAGDFHLRSLDFPMRRANALGLEGWRKLVSSLLPLADTIQSGLANLLEEELAFLTAQWPKDLPKGHIHADLFRDNVFFIGNRLSGIIDFYFSCWDFLAYDLAIIVNAWCFDEETNLDLTQFSSLMDGYEARRPLTYLEKDAFVTLCRGAALRFLLTRSYDWLHPEKDALVRPKDPIEYIRKLEFFRQASALRNRLFP